MDQPVRLRRNRNMKAVRNLLRETRLSPSDLVYPVFIQDSPHHDPIDAMPGLTRFGLGVDADPTPFLEHIQQTHASGIPALALFPKIDPALKTPLGDEAANPEGLVPRTVRLLKQHLPSLAVITDVALDPYSSIGHDGVLAEPDPQKPWQSPEIDNDRTVEALCQQALAHAQAGADYVAPSDMMDGRVGAIRQTLDAHGHTQTGILSYTAKYASAFYGPFRGALDSAPVEADNIPKDKASYQMDPANAREALREMEQDEAEGADIMMVKPAGPYLDIVYRLREATDLPIAAYQVSGEYIMLHAAAQTGGLELKPAVLESLTGIKRAGADIIFTYFAPQVAQWLREG